MSWDDPDRYNADIARALATQGGHLSIGRGGFTLHYDTARLSGYDCDTIKTAAIAVGLPVIDSREAPFDAVAQLAVRGPMIAVNRSPSPRPWHAFAQASLAVVATAYRRAGAEVHNIPESPEDDAIFDAMPAGPEAALIDFWLNHVRTNA